MVKFMFINKNALRRCCVGIALSSLCSVSGMSSLKPEMINEKMLKATVDKYKEVIRGMRDYENRVYIGLVLQTFVDNHHIGIEGFVEGRISDDFWDTVVKFAKSLDAKCLWLYGDPYTVVKKYIDSLEVWKSSDEPDNQSFIRRLFRGKVAKSHVIDVSWLTKEFVDQCIEKMVADMVVTKDEIEVVTSPSADLVDVDDEIKQILPRGKCFRNFIVLLSELNERIGYSITLPSVSDFVDLGRRFIALVKENSESAKKVAGLEQKGAELVGDMQNLKSKADQIGQEKKKIEGEKIRLENELKRIQEQLSEARKYATDGVYLSDNCLKVMKTIDSSNLNGITPSTDIEKVSVYNNEKLGLVSKENEEKAKLLDKGTHDVYDSTAQGVYDRTTQIVLTKAKIAEEATDREAVNALRADLLKSDIRIKGYACKHKLTLSCRNPTGTKAKDPIRGEAEAELEQIFPYIKTIASLFVNVDYSNFNCTELSLLTPVKAELKLVSGWKNINPFDKFCADEARSAISDALFKWLESARFAAFSAATTLKDSMLECKIGDATNADKLMAQLLFAAIAGYSAEDIKKTF